MAALRTARARPRQQSAGRERQTSAERALRARPTPRARGHTHSNMYGIHAHTDARANRHGGPTPPPECVRRRRAAAPGRHFCIRKLGGMVMAAATHAGIHRPPRDPAGFKPQACMLTFYGQPQPQQAAESTGRWVAACASMLPIDRSRKHRTHSKLSAARRATSERVFRDECGPLWRGWPTLKPTSFF